MFRWMFESRETGKITIVQLPNLALAIFLGLRSRAGCSIPVTAWYHLLP